jgi:hypothetical protein
MMGGAMPLEMRAMMVRPRFDRFPSHPPSPADEEALLARLDAAPTILCGALGDADASSALPVVRTVAMWEAWLGDAFDSRAAGGPLAAASPPAIPLDREPSTASLADFFAERRAASLAAPRALGGELWDEAAIVGDERVSAYQFLAAFADAGDAWLALLRPAA